MKTTSATSSPCKCPCSESEPVAGYLHAVSPVKVSRNNRYFDATLQTGREEFRHVVCFSLKKRAVFVQASDNQQAVKLVDCRKDISKSFLLPASSLGKAAMSG